MALGTDQRMQDWLDAMGLALPAGAPSKAQLRSRGSVHINAHDFPGEPTDPFVQEDAWPRTGATAFGKDIPSDVIPVQIEHAVYAAGYFEALNPGSLTSRSSLDAGVKRKRVRVEGAVDTETEYFADGSAAPGAAVTIPMVEDLLAPFLLGDEPETAFGILALG